MDSSREHEEIIELFDEYYDEELGEEEHQKVKQHLQQCERCREEYEAYIGSLSLLKGLHSNQAPKDLVDGVTDTIQRKTKGRFFNEPRLLGVRLPYEVFAALLLGLLATIYLFGVRSKGTMEVRDPQLDQEQVADDLEGSEALGSQSPRLERVLPSTVDIEALGEYLEARGYRVKPALAHATPALEIDLAIADLAKLLTSIEGFTGVQLQGFEVRADGERLTLVLVSP